jgi:hypothetical protein
MSACCFPHSPSNRVPTANNISGPTSSLYNPSTYNPTYKPTYKPTYSNSGSLDDSVAAAELTPIPPTNVVVTPGNPEYDGAGAGGAGGAGYNSESSSSGSGAGGAGAGAGY